MGDNKPPNLQEISQINQITAEIVLLKNQTAQNIIEIGKRLIQVKEMLPHGHWGKWLEEKVDLSHRNANNFMRVAKEISNSQTYSNLTQSKVFALLDLPPEQREDFIENNPVEEMTTRELQAAIKAQKDLEQKLQQQAKELNYALQREFDLERENQKLKEQPTVVETIEVEKIIEVVPEELLTELERLKEQQRQLDSEKSEINGLQQKKNKLNNEIAEIMSKVYKLQHKDQELAVASTFINQVDKSLKPLKENKARLELAIKSGLRLPAVYVKELETERLFLYDMIDLIDKAIEQVLPFEEERMFREYEQSN